MICERLKRMYDAAIGASFDKQLRVLEKLNPSQRWTYRPELGTVEARTPGRLFGLRADLLGLESECGARWTWGWALPPGTAPADTLASVQKLRELGRKEEIVALLTPSFDLQGRCGHWLASMASGTLDAGYYVECETERGSLYFLVDRRWLPKIDEEPVQRVARVFPPMVERLSRDIGSEREAFAAYLKFYGLRIERTKQGAETRITGTDSAGRRVASSFDVNGRSLQLELRHGTFEPDCPLCAMMGEN